jgi:hypothetical protein
VPRGNRGTRRAVLLIAFAALVAAVLGLSRMDDGRDSTRTIPSDSVSASPPLAKTCEARPTREACRDISIGGRTWRYSVLKASSATADTVLLDFGGPGQSVLSGAVGLADFQSAFPGLSGRFNILVLEEPWVTEDLPTSCDGALSAFYLAVRAAVEIDRRAADLAARCDISGSRHHWGFTAATYSAVISGIREREGLNLRGFVGRSWAATRFTYLDGGAFDFAILLRPYPVGVDADSLIAERARRIDPFRSLGRPLTAGTTATRSLPVIEFDRQSAFVELGYADDGYVRKYFEAVRSGRDLEVIGSLSDELWGRYGKDSLSPAFLAQLQEICPQAGAPQESVRLPSTSVAGVIGASLAPCRFVERKPTVPKVAPKTCIVTSPSDSVAPSALIRRMFGKMTGTRWIEVRTSSHGSLDGLESCLTEVS